MDSHSPTVRQTASRILFAACLLCLFSGCAHLPSRPLIGQPRQTDEEATVNEVLASLAKSEQAIVTFSAVGAFTIESPEFSATKYFKDGVISFRRPADLSVVARKLLGTTVMRLTCVGDAFLMEFPATHDKPYYRLADGRTREVPFSVSPSVISREMFFPEMWDRLTSKEVRLIGRAPDTKAMILEIGPEKAPRRRVTVSGPPWEIVRDERLDEHGDVVSISIRDDYRETNGVRVPHHIDAQFPSERTRMTFDMREIQVNGPIEPSLFDLKERAKEAGIGEGNGL